MLGDGSLARQGGCHDRKRWGWQDRVTRAGHVPNIDPYLADADVLLMTSHYEGRPAVAVEALAQWRAGGQHRLFAPCCTK